MFSFFRKNKSKPPPPTHLRRPKTRSQTKQASEEPSEEPSEEQLSKPISTSIPTSKPSVQSIELQNQNHRSNPSNQTHHFKLNDIQDLHSYLSIHQNPLSLLDLLNLISNSQSNQSTKTEESNVNLLISLSSTHQLQSTDSQVFTNSLEPSNPYQSTNSFHSSNQTSKRKAKRTIEEDDHDLASEIISDYEFINPSSPLNSNQNQNLNLNLKSNHTTPTKKIKIEKPKSKSTPKFDLRKSNYNSKHFNQIKPQLFHGLSIEIWNQIFNIINQSTLNQINITSNANQEINLKHQIDLLIKFQIESHQFQLISKALSPLTKSNSWSFLFLNNYRKIQYITRLLESDSSLTQLINTCYIILPTHHSQQSTYKTPGKSFNRQSMILLNEKPDDFSGASVIRSRSSTLLNSLVTNSPIKSNPIYTHQRRFETPKTLNINSNQSKLEDENLYIQEIPSLLFSLSSNLKTLYINSPERICTKLLNSLSNLSHQLSLLESLTIIGGGDLMGLMGLINGLSLLPFQSNLNRLIVTGPSLTIGDDRYKKFQNENQLNRSHSNSINQFNYPLELNQIEIGNGIPLSINEIYLIIQKVKPNRLNSLKFNLSLIDFEIRNDQSQSIFKFNEIFKNSSNSLNHLSIEEDWFNSTNSLESSSSSGEESSESKEGMILDQALMNLNCLKSLDLSNFKSIHKFCSNDFFNFLPITLEEIKLFNPNYQILNNLINGKFNLINLKKLELFGCNLRNGNGNQVGNGNQDGNSIRNDWNALDKLNKLGIQVIFN